MVEEQTRNSELRDVLKEREQSLRKAEQEMDSLTFRNQQLTKRVTVLQDELDLMQAGDLQLHLKKKMFGYQSVVTVIWTLIYG